MVIYSGEVFAGFLPVFLVELVNVASAIGV